jgi:hypothetical protein
VDSNILAGLIVVADRALFHPDVEVKGVSALDQGRHGRPSVNRREGRGGVG